MRYPLLIFLLLFNCHLNAQHQPDTASQNNFFTSFDGTKIYYERIGAGKPVLLVHGFTGSSQSWRTTILSTRLLLWGFEAIMVDLRGNGRSGKPASENGYADNAEAKDLKGLMQFLNIRQYDVIGYSRGSIVAAGLLLLDTAINKAVLGGMGDGFTTTMWPRRLQFYKALCGQPSKETEGLMKYVRSKNFDTVQLAWQQKYQPSVSPAELKKINKQVLLIDGDADIDNGSPQALATMFNKGSLVIVKGDHNTTSASAEFAAAVIRFLLQKN